MALWQSSTTAHDRVVGLEARAPTRPRSSVPNPRTRSDCIEPTSHIDLLEDKFTRRRSVPRTVPSYPFSTSPPYCFFFACDAIVVTERGLGLGRLYDESQKMTMVNHQFENKLQGMSLTQPPRLSLIPSWIASLHPSCSALNIFLDTEVVLTLVSFICSVTGIPAITY